MDQNRALLHLKEIEKLSQAPRLAAEGWDEDWKTLIAIAMSARTTDKKTIPTAEYLFSRYDSVEKLSKAKEKDIAQIIKPVNFYKTKAKNISNMAKMLVKEHKGIVPHDFNKLVELPGVGRKTANVFLAEHGYERIGVDTHLAYCSQKLGWTKNKDPYKIEMDLEKLFPKKIWVKLNRTVVRFGQTYTSRKVKNEVLARIKRI